MTSSSSSAVPMRTGGGVADYYAILGVGDCLTWKHTQKQQEEEGDFQQQQQQSPQEETATTPPAGEVHDNNSMLLLEGDKRTNNEDYQDEMARWHREIVDVAIIAVASNNDQQEERMPEELEEGWNIIQQTVVPAYYYFSSTTTIGVSSTHQHNNYSSSPPQNRFDANLDWQCGLPNEILQQQVRRLEQHQQRKQQADYAAAASNNDNRQMIKTRNLVRQTVESKIIRSWQHKLNPQQHNNNNSHPDDDHNIGVPRRPNQPPLLPWTTNKKRKKLYLAYRRRGNYCRRNNNNNGDDADVDTKPAIADVQVYYVRLHRRLLIDDDDDDHDEDGRTAPPQPAPQQQPQPPTTKTEKIAALAGQILMRNKPKRQTTTVKESVAESAIEVVVEANRSASSSPSPTTTTSPTPHDKFVLLEDYLPPPEQVLLANATNNNNDVNDDEDGGTTIAWSIPKPYQWIRDPAMVTATTNASAPSHDEHPRTSVMYDDVSSTVEAVEEEEEETTSETTTSITSNTTATAAEPRGGLLLVQQQLRFRPQLVLDPARSSSSTTTGQKQRPSKHDDEDNMLLLPILALRRQRIQDEERYHEDPAIVDISVSFYDGQGQVVRPSTSGHHSSHQYHPNTDKMATDPKYDGNNNNNDDANNNHDDSNHNDEEDHENFYYDDNEDEDDEDEEDRVGTFRLLGKTDWACWREEGTANVTKDDAPTPRTGTSTLRRNNKGPMSNKRMLGIPVLLTRKNCPFGFADTAFATRVFGRFPFANYKGLPLPEEELPMFCYPTGCRLHRAQFSDAPLPQYYGFVVKNERGDSIYVSCVSFMEPLTRAKEQQLERMSEQSRHFSLPHRRFCERQQRRSACGGSGAAPDNIGGSSSCLLMAFDDMTTFENKTICLVSRYPFWTAFRKFLSHLHILSGSCSEVPLERWISHLLLSVPLPKAGGRNVLIPLPALNEPMIMSLPPDKDFPLLDLPYNRLFACLDIKTIVTIVLGLLALERKVIVMSTRPSLVLDVCELLRSLLFPFELCAPYVPRLTEPFQSSLEFPGAIFVGIHDDGEPHGLASMVKRTYPEDSIVVDLDTGAVDCDGDRYETLRGIWDIIPESSRSNLVSELETLCRDAKIVDGQEPVDSLYDSAFYVDLHDAVEGYGVNTESREALDDRAIRDAFLRFFCSVLGGYERFLVVPDAEFMVSGNEWFDAKGFLASVPSGRAAYLNALVSTQLFQSFIQRRTEDSDVHCMLFDECLTEYHSTTVPYGRLGGDVETISTSGTNQPQMLYSLLVDQSATLPAGSDPTTIAPNKSLDASDTDSSFSLNLSKASASVADSSVAKYSEAVVNPAGDLVTTPSRLDLPFGKQYIYCVDGNPCFPYYLNRSLLLPQEPVACEIETSKKQNPLLIRSDRELEEATRRRRAATSYRGQQNNRRCLWQLPKLMGSHFLGSWLLCIPSQVTETNLTEEQQSRFLLRALGALRLLRSKQRIVPDEAAYRALMVACGRTKRDRRVELVKLFGLLRSDGIFPSAVTLGQYTKALAEGYSKRSFGASPEEDSGFEWSESGNRSSRSAFGNPGAADLHQLLYELDPTLQELESHGRRWRHKYNSERNMPFGKDGNGAVASRKRSKSSKCWLPVFYSTSFVPKQCGAQSPTNEEIRLLAIWSRTHSCSNCGYIPLEEEIQAGWDVVGGEHEVPGAIACPRCDSLIVPMLGYREMTHDQAYSRSSVAMATATNSGEAEDAVQLPPQISTTIKAPSPDDDASFVAYLSPASLRLSLEQYIEEYGEEILQRDRLQQTDPEVFYNFWWYSARFSLPLPLPVSESTSNAVAFAAWEREAAERGCYSAGKVLSHLIRRPFDNGETAVVKDKSSIIECFEDAPLLSRFNLQGFYSAVWDHPDLSKLLVTLVEACDRRDFKLVVESALQSNERRRNELGVSIDSSSDIAGTDIVTSSDGARPLSSVELDVYRTILYLAKYQCTTAFHTFFPATLKPCKGYHFWCAIGTPLPVFDRLLRDAIRRLKNSKDQAFIVPIHDVSDVALGFRCVFGHLI